MERIKYKPAGGPERKAYGIDGVVPVNFNDDDPFFDLGLQLNNIQKRVRDGKTVDVILIEKSDGEVRYYWRGRGRMTGAIGALEYVKDMIYEETVR